MASVLFGLGLLAVAAGGQPPAEPKKAPEKKADPVDALIAAALVHDADVRMAQAKLQLADAELAKARQAVAVKVITLTGAIEEQKRQIAASEDRVAWATRMFQKGVGGQEQLLAEREKLESAKARLSQLETELKLITGGKAIGAGADADWSNLDKVHAGAVWGTSCLTCHQAPVGKGAGTGQHAALALEFLFRAAGKPPATGPIADRIRAALDKKVKLDGKVSLESFKKEAELDVAIRVSFIAGPIDVMGQNEELPVGAWLQLFQDFNGGVFYVREYGLLFTTKEAAPADAVTVTQFWKQPPAKAESRP